MRESQFADLVWRKSSRSESQFQECVEVARVAWAVAVRDSKDPDGPVLAIDAQVWRGLLTTLKTYGT
ncbi:DUF397 domain-containing protein [Actinomadura fibrosa]|uniref:DUF397 domain-containing protein n=1 Tax=Actinomadura fibrosa TaxID=111802 RepID=A0ABW2XRL8_9ACTN|nr:DUF397 domain-containing protein [Actinomadura fibrosa]